MDDNGTLHYLATFAVAIVSGAFTGLLRRTVNQQDETIRSQGEQIRTNTGTISDLRVEIARHQSNHQALADQLRLLRDDLGEVKEGIVSMNGDIKALLQRVK